MFADQVYITMGQAGMITIFSMTTVFLSLLVISYVIDLIRMAFSPKKKEEVKKEEPQVIVVPGETDEDLLPIVIMAAIEEYEREKNSNPIVRNREGL